MSDNKFIDRANRRIEIEKGQSNLAAFLKMATAPVAIVAGLVTGYMLAGSEAGVTVMKAVPEAAGLVASVNVPLLGEFIFTRLDVVTMGILGTAGGLLAVGLGSMLEAAREAVSDALLAAHWRDAARR